MSAEDAENSFRALFEQMGAPKRRRSLRVGDRVDGVVIRVGKDSVFVELEDRQEAMMEAAELRAEDGTMSVAEGDRLSAQIVEVDTKQGLVRLGRTLGKGSGIAHLEQAKEARMAVEGKVTGVNKGGLDVDFGGTRAFCPMSQADARTADDAKALIGQTHRFLVTDIKDGGRNVVVSRRAVREREAREGAAKVLAHLAPGAVLQGSVTSVRDFGAFVDLGGVEGLIPRGEIAHDRSVSIADALRPGELVQVQVLEIKDVPNTKGSGTTRRITLSLKALAADPWADLDIAPGRVVLGTVSRATEFGRFVRLAPGVEGLLHVSELGRSFSAEEGQELRVVIKSIDKQAKKISLTPAPADAAVGAVLATNKVTVGAIVRGQVERHETYGIFVQLEGTRGRDGRGLVPNNELGVTRGTDVRKTFPEGSAVTAKVLETGDGRLRLSIKAAKEAEERADFEQARAKGSSPASLGTFADLLKRKK